MFVATQLGSRLSINLNQLHDSKVLYFIYLLPRCYIHIYHN